MNPFYLPPFFSFLFFASVIFADDAKLTKIPVNAGFITALTADDSGVFIGTEDNGVFRYDNEGKITHYTTKDGLGDDNAYALAVDKLGRLWVGHQYSGVSVFNGKEWKNYDVVDGPIGERIFDICPTDSDVWLATSAGITRYRIDTDTWTDITREDGLPEDQCSSLAFLKDGTLIAGTQCHGLAIFTRDKDGNYKHAKNIVAPERFGKKNESPVPLTPRGDGLPSNCINKILVTADKIWIATTAGLVTADNTLTKLRYVRGVDYIDKVKGLYGGAPKDWEECPKEEMEQLLPEDYITSLSVIDDKLYIGTRQKGFVVFDKTGKPLQQQYTNKNGLPNNYVSVLCSRANNLYIGTYGGGAYRVSGSMSQLVEQSKEVELPSVRTKPTAEELLALFYKLKGLEPQNEKTKIIALNDDWRTKGNWIDRVGKFAACLCGQAGGTDYDEGYYVQHCAFANAIGRNYKQKDDAVRFWVHWDESNDQRVLQCLQLGGRKQAEWDDHGEAYPMALDGPHIYGSVQLPKSKFIISFYFFNKDGHEGKNRFRDFTLTLKTFAVPQDTFSRLGMPNVEIETLFMRANGGVTSRTTNFWGGVYKRFYVEVAEGENVNFKIDRNGSYNTILSGVFIDTVKQMNGLDLEEPFMPKRKLTNMAETLEDAREYPWWAANGLDRVLYLRDSQPDWYFAFSRQYLLQYFRAHAQLKNGEPFAPTGINKKDKEFIRKGLALTAADVQLFNLQDKIDFYKHQYKRCGWERQSKLNRKDKLLRWDDDYFKQWTKEYQAKETW